MGFKTEKFVKSVDENLFCSICHEVFEDPVSCKDGHTFCSDCITTWLKANKKCPLDNGVLDERQLVRLFTVKGIIDNLEVYCHPLTEEVDQSEVEQFEVRCDWVGKLQNLPQHRKSCPFQVVQCPHVGCNKIMQRKQLENHEKMCEFRKVECDMCGMVLLQHEKEKHIRDDCLQAVICCPNQCKDEQLTVEIKRIDLDEHLSKVCPKTLVDCPYKEQGCEVKVERQDVEKHVQENMAGHMMFLAKECSSLRKENKTLTNQCFSLVHRNTQLTNQLRHVWTKFEQIGKEFQTYTWTIPGFRSQIVKRNLHYFRSPTFWLCGYSWYLKIFPWGESRDVEGFLSLYLYASFDPNCHNNGYYCVVFPNDKISVRFIVTVKSRDSYYPGVSREAEHVFRYKKEGSYGWSEFMETEELYSETYYDSKNDNITIKCKIELAEPQ